MSELTENQLHELLAQQVTENIEALETEMLKHEPIDIPVEHRFVNGMYAREIVIPAGTLLTGRVHTNAYVDIMLSGKISVATPDGVKTLEGVNIMEGVPGRKRAGYAHEDTRWLTVHNTPATTGDEYVETETFMTMQEYRTALGCDAAPQLEKTACQS